VRTEDDLTVDSDRCQQEEEQGFPIELVLWVLLLVIGLLELKVDRQAALSEELESETHAVSAYGF
jgi:hypothetical protein